ncbi:MAG TPA: hypothetical protein DCE44_08870 [Verrucomicrobiales bacterium]|nr:hypothetical protein [Verrucomicrobiales bacterium]
MEWRGSGSLPKWDAKRVPESEVFGEQELLQPNSSRDPPNSHSSDQLFETKQKGADSGTAVSHSRDVDHGVWTSKIWM